MGGPSEEEREGPLEVKREKGEDGGFGAEERGVVPLEVAGDLGGHEKLRRQRRGAGGADQSVG